MELQDFDIILFSGRDYWFSYVVEMFTFSPFSHVGILLKSPTYLKEDLTGDYLFESGYESVPDAIEDRIKWGVQITDFNKILKAYPGRVYYRRIRIPEEKKKVLKKSIPEIYKKIGDAPYDTDPFDFLRIELGLDVGNCRKTDTFFCSAFTTYLFAQCGLIAPTIQWDMITPKQFAYQWIRDELKAVDSRVDIGELVRIK